MNYIPPHLAETRHETHLKQLQKNQETEVEHTAREKHCFKTKGARIKYSVEGKQSYQQIVLR